MGLLKLYSNVDFDLEAEEQKWFASLETLRSLPQVDGEYYINNALKEGKKVLAEGAQGSMLDIDFGTYPFVTSSNTITAGVCSGLGIAPSKVGEVIGISKAYCTRVGSGPFPTELHDATGDFLRKEGAEFGATTGRARRCGWFDAALMRRSRQVNGLTSLCLTKLDVLDGLNEIKICVGYDYDSARVEVAPIGAEALQQCQPIYESMPGWQGSTAGVTQYDELPQQAKNYIDRLQTLVEVPIDIISTGPDRDETIVLRNPYQME